MNKQILNSVILIFSGVLLFQCSEQKENTAIYESEQLKIHSISENVFVHESFLQTDDFGKVSCNGLIFHNGGSSIIFDTPAENGATIELITWVEDSLKTKVMTVVPTHFHEDCLGGLDAVHEKGIPSIAHQMTIELAVENELLPPKQGFRSELTMKVGKMDIVVSYQGEGHTRDNVVAYIPSEEVIFGGCLVKRVGAGRGYTGDANLSEWSNTVARVKEKFPNAQTIVPGHGQWGGQELLDYTVELFQEQ